MAIADPNRVILTGENPFIRLSDKDGDPFDRRQLLAHPVLPGRARATCSISRAS